MFGLRLTHRDIDEAWSREWNVFLRCIVKLLEGGSSDSDISAAFEEHGVEWSGTVKSVDLDQEYSPGVALSMGTPEVPLRDGRVLRADHLMLFVGDDRAAQWRGVEVGQVVRFNAKVPAKSNGSDAVGFFHSKRKPLVGLELGLIDCSLVGQGDPRDAGNGVSWKCSLPWLPSRLAWRRIASRRLPPLFEVSGMPNPDLDALLASLADLRVEDFLRDSSGILALEGICAQLVALHPFKSWAPDIVRVMERLGDAVDLGSPGPIVHALEKNSPDHEPLLEASLHRRPTSLAVWMVDRILRTQPRGSTCWVGLLDSVNRNPCATLAAKESVEDMRAEGLLG